MFNHFHPYKPFIKKDTKRIIVGTLPPPRFCTKNYKQNDVIFCYGSKDGLLWKALDKIYNLDLLYDNSELAIEQRKNFLIKEKIDASDIGMKEVILRNILKYLKNYPNINTIIFTGGYCKNSPEYFLRKVLKEKNIKFEIGNDNIPKVHKFEYDNRTFKTISLTSPSNAANRSIGANSYYKEQKKKNPNYTTFDFRLEQYEKVFKFEYLMNTYL